MLIGIIQINQAEFPTLFRIALNYLSIQASAIPCKYVFLSTKEMNTLKCNCIHTLLIEVLQTLKFLLKKEWLSFTGGWQTVLSNMKRAKSTGTTKDLLAHLLTNDHQATTNVLLSMLSDCNDDDDDDDDNNDNDDINNSGLKNASHDNDDDNNNDCKDDDNKE